MSVIILRGDAAHLPLPDESADLIVTSPPYFGQRDYRDGGESLAGQIGSEETPAAYVAALLRCTREWMRVLKPGGNIVVNLGDKYSNYFGRNWGHGHNVGGGERGRSLVPVAAPVSAPNLYGIPAKSLMGLPWRYAFGCMDGLGLILRRDIIWRKNGQPESVTDRSPTEHEYLFHFTRRQRYYSACDDIREPLTAPGRKAGAGAFGARNANHERTATGAYDGQNPLGRIPGSVWDIPTEPLVVPDRIAHARCCGGRKREGCEDGLAHHAAWPTALARRIILGWSPPGICTACGEGRRPVTEASRTIDGQPVAGLGHWKRGRGEVSGIGNWRFGTDRQHAGYTCACPDASAPTRAALIVDPFGGTGTTMLTASVLGRIGVGVELSADYCRLAQWRTSDPAERARALGVPKPPLVPDGQGSLFDGLEAG